MQAPAREFQDIVYEATELNCPIDPALFHYDPADQQGNIAYYGHADINTLHTELQKLGAW